MRPTDVSKTRCRFNEPERAPAVQAGKHVAFRSAAANVPPLSPAEATEKGHNTMNWAERRERLRSTLAKGRCIYPGSVYDAISARIAEDLGFEAGMFAGSIGSHTVLGAPDVVVLTLTEFAAQAYRINRAGNLPLCVDADHGYGNALNVKRTVEELETAGVAALTIEDTLLPTAFGGTDSQLISIEEGVGKMKAALAGRQDKNLVIVGRTSAIAITGVKDAVARAKAYEAAGVDMIFFAGVKTRAQLDAAAAEVKIPMFLGSPGQELYDLDYLSARNVRICLQGHLPFWAGVRAVYETLKALREGTPSADIKTAASADLQKQVLRQADYAKWGKSFLGTVS
jgi:carboxyvinyl-carboxyphosphonate phosphorylmutase